MQSPPVLSDSALPELGEEKGETQLETQAAGACPAYYLPSRILSVLVLLLTVLTGSLINIVPQLNEMLSVESVWNCTLPYPPVKNATTEGEAWIWLWPVLLPVAFLLVKDWNLELDREKIVALYHHASGQAVSFSSTEIIRHFIVSPNQAFPQKCNLTLSDCLMYKNVVTNTSQLCQNSNLPDREIFDSLHSVPQVTAALMGASTVFLLCNLRSAQRALAPLFQVHPTCQDYKFCSRRLLKFLCLGAFLAAAYFCLWQTVRGSKNSLQDLALSYAYGLAVQLTVYKTQQTDLTAI